MQVVSLESIHLQYSRLRNHSTMEPIPPVTILGVEYPALADGKYDAVILGTGLKECIVAGLLATEGKKVSFPGCF